MKFSGTNRTALRMTDAREEIIERLMQAAGADGACADVLPGLSIARSSSANDTMCSVQRPSFCFVAQGNKRALLGDRVFRYDPLHYLIFTVDLPLSFQIRDATEEKPYLGFALELDQALVASVLAESGLRLKKSETSVTAMNAAAIDADMLDAVVRLIRLIDSPPGERAILLPLVQRELVFRLLAGGQGARLSHLLASTDTRRISRAITLLKENFDRQLRIDDIARELGMSVSGFHQHFKNVTAMSPLQYQKQIRLQEARRLMLGENLDAATAGFRVGYEDPSYFSRDYKKQFGAPPQRDIASIRGELAA